MEQGFIRKPKYIFYAEQAQKRKENKYKAVFESDEYATYLENRKKLKKPEDISQEKLYKGFLKSQQQRRYNQQKKEQITEQFWIV